LNYSPTSGGRSVGMFPLRIKVTELLLLLLLLLLLYLDRLGPMAYYYSELFEIMYFADGW
jgi:hypothetical protein